MLDIILRPKSFQRFVWSLGERSPCEGFFRISAKAKVCLFRLLLLGRLRPDRSLQYDSTVRGVLNSCTAKSICPSTIRSERMSEALPSFLHIMFPPSHHSGAASGDSAVRSTDSDALLSRVSAAKQGYLDDSFSPLFLTPAQRRSTERRPPLINIGTHARTWAVDELVEQFLRTGVREGEGSEVKAVQVLSLGAGTDTRYWRMRKKWSERKGEESWPCRKWVEVDFPEATSSKARTIATKGELKAQLGGDVKIGMSTLEAWNPGGIVQADSVEIDTRTRRTWVVVASLRSRAR